MNTLLFKEFKQAMCENGYHKNGDLWGSAMSAFFQCCAHLYEKGDCAPEWQYRPGCAGNVIDPDDSMNYFFETLNAAQLTEIGAFLFRLTHKLELANLSY